ncbi:MAG: TIGR03619 family F420-dependent LLM class oxidoreductase [Sphingomonas sp.]
MKLAFAMPRLLELKATMQPWELTVTGADQTMLARKADALGYDMLSVPEHFIMPHEHVDLSGPHYFHAYAGMGYFAGATERIRVNSSVAILPLQNPVVAAKALATIDWLNGGRTTVTFGVGWLEREFEILGLPFRERGAMADEYLAAMIALWTEDNPSFEGRYVSFRDVVARPQPVQKPHLPIWMGGDADGALRRAARFASGWWPFLTRPEAIPARLDFIRSQPDYNGRLDEVFYGFATTRVGEGHAVHADPRARPGMSLQEIVDRLNWFATLGVTMSSAPIPAVSGIDAYLDYAQWVIEEVRPRIDRVGAGPA